MDTIDRSHSNLPAQFSAPLAPLPTLTPAFPVDQAALPALQVSPKVIIRGLSRHWWRILLLGIVASAPLMTLIYYSIQPTYEASSLLRIEPASPELFGTIKGSIADGRSLTYLQTQANLITSTHVLKRAVTDPLVVNLPMIKHSEDPVHDLRRKLMVDIHDDTSLLRVALELGDPNEAITIVNAVVDSYMKYNAEYSRGANKELTESLTKQLGKLQNQIEVKKAALKELLRKSKGKIKVLEPEKLLNTKDESDPAQPTFKSLSEDQFHRMMAEMVQTDLQLIEAQAMLDAKEDAKKASQEEIAQMIEKVDEEQILEQITEEFQKDPEVVTLTREIDETRAHLDHLKQNVRKPNDPSRRAAQDQFDKLKKEYENLWNFKYKKLRAQLNGAGGKQSAESIRDLELKIASLKRKKEKQADLFKTMKVEQQATNDDTFEATYLDYEVRKMQNREDQVDRNLEQLKFEAQRDNYRVVLVDLASAPKNPSNDKRVKYMAAAPVGILFMMLGLFLLLEIKAERVADPDALSTRVRSEVYALPPLPTARALRRLSGSEADDQIEQFIQRLDHLRFAVCGNPAELGKGRCVLITSAIGCEGKTTLAAQLAARCGNAGMSTLLIDADLRKAALCPLLDVPEGPGLSDVLKDEATIDEVAIPVQGGTFYLLPAGTPIQDTSRVLQGAKFGQMIGQLRQLYDLIIIDSPPVLPVPDALILGRWADGAVIAARYDISRFPQVERARRQLDNAGIAILGTVINGMRHSDSYYGRYTYNRQRSNPAGASNTI
jgi:succinoglycan biosynthesis transport protein ExoP